MKISKNNVVKSYNFFDDKIYIDTDNPDCYLELFDLIDTGFAEFLGKDSKIVKKYDTFDNYKWYSHDLFTKPRHPYKPDIYNVSAIKSKEFDIYVTHDKELPHIQYFCFRKFTGFWSKTCVWNTKRQTLSEAIIKTKSELFVKFFKL